MKWFRWPFGDAPQPIVVVSGLPRTGTSMMMRMVEAGGIPALTDELRVPDPDNPRGYYELERVKALERGDAAWLVDAPGRAVKVISTLLRHLPATHEYRIVYMHRQIGEVLSSQQKMMARAAMADEGAAATDDPLVLGKMLRSHDMQIRAWVDEQPNMQVLDVNYNALIANAQPAVQRVADFLAEMNKGALDTGAMAQVVEPGLYRNRG